MLLRLFLVLIPVLLAQAAPSATVLVVRFNNTSPYPDLDWVGESVAETLRSEFNQSGQIVPDRNASAEGMNRLALRPDAVFTKATLIRLGRTLDADQVVYGTYEVKLSPDSSRLQDSSVNVTMRFIDLRKLKDGPDITEAGKLSDLARLEEHLAWEALKYVQPSLDLSLDKFLAPQKLTRLDAEESYIRGLLSSNKEQQQKWFLQAANLDPHFVAPLMNWANCMPSRKTIAWPSNGSCASRKMISVTRTPAFKWDSARMAQPITTLLETTFATSPKSFHSMRCITIWVPRKTS